MSRSLLLGLGLAASGGGAPWTPSNLGSARIADWSAAAANITLDGSLNVQTWADISGNGLTLSQGTPANRPGYSSSGGGNNQGYVVSSLNTLLVTTATPTIPQPVEVLIVARTTSAAPAANSYIIDFSSNINALFQQSGALNLQQYSGTLGAVVALTANVDFAVAALFSGAASQLVLNGAAPVVANAGTGGSTTAAITVGSTGGGGSGFTGRIYRVIPVNRPLSVGERAQWRAYAQRTYGTP